MILEDLWSTKCKDEDVQTVILILKGTFDYGFNVKGI